MHSTLIPELSLDTQESFRHCLAQLFEVTVSEVPEFEYQPLNKLFDQWQEWSRDCLSLHMLISSTPFEHSNHCIALGTSKEGSHCVLWRNGSATSTIHSSFTPSMFIDFGLMVRTNSTSNAPSGAIDLMEIASNR